MIRVATYNAHDCIGRDGVYDPARIANIVAAIGADVVALQEITLDHAGDVLATLRNVTGMQAIDGTLFDRGVGRYGNVLLTRHEVTEQRLHDLSFSGREPRGMVDAAIDINGKICRVAATHLGLKIAERRQQMQRLATLLADDALPAVLMGDFNVWLGSRAFAPLSEIGFVQQPLRSFPTWWMPLWPLDRVLFRGPTLSQHYWRYDEPPALRASDHFPIVVDVDAVNPVNGSL
jgi:endonuclease/exonuclease/phosphatase family metal-dependent hydrolase